MGGDGIETLYLRKNHHKENVDHCYEEGQKQFSNAYSLNNVILVTKAL